MGVKTQLPGAQRDCGQHVYVLVITPLRGMSPVYRPEGGRPINRNIQIRGVIIDL